MGIGFQAACYGAVFETKRGEVFFVGARVAEKLVFACGQIYAVKRGRGFLPSDKLGVGGKVGGDGFAVLDGEPCLVG